MNTRSRLVVVWLVVLSVVCVAAACSRHSDDFPPTLALLESPPPLNFQVTTSNDIDYVLTWVNPEPTTVSFYRIYVPNIFTGFFELVDSTSVTNVQLSTGIATPGLIFGLSSVSVGNVESSLVFAGAQ